ncbi:MAG: PaaI family thioesterase [Polyangiaceae bacterium]|nr:PaaI family thioesterase [Polyangiaceae bacterium]
MTDEAPDFSEMLNAHRGGWNDAMRLVFKRATADEVEAELTIDELHRQPYGIVHGGVYAGIIETLCSTGAALYAGRNGQTTVGLENHTSFLRATRAGRLRVRATPLQRGRRAQVWEGSVYDDEERLVATGRVRLICLEGGAALAGETVGVQS